MELQRTPLSLLTLPRMNGLLDRSLGPECRCGSRSTKRVGYSEDSSINSDTSALVRQCQNCGQTYVYRVIDGRLLPLAPVVAVTLDDHRANPPRCKCGHGFSDHGQSFPFDLACHEGGCECEHFYSRVGAR